LIRFGVWGPRSGVWSIAIEASGFRSRGSRFMVLGLGVRGAGFEVAASPHSLHPRLRFRVCGLWFGVWGLEFGVMTIGSRVSCVRERERMLRHRLAQGSGLAIWGLGLRVRGFERRVENIGLRM